MNEQLIYLDDRPLVAQIRETVNGETIAGFRDIYGRAVTLTTDDYCRAQDVTWARRAALS